jgi:hypothetical protein
VADVRDLDHFFANAVEDFVRILDDKLYPNIGIVGLVAAVWLVGQLCDGGADARAKTLRAPSGDRA